MTSSLSHSAPEELSKETSATLPHYDDDLYQESSKKDVSHDTELGIVEEEPNHKLLRNLKGRHMQMIAIGGSIGAGLFVGSGSALETGGPASLLIGFIIVGVMLLCTIFALGELAVLYPVNGAFFEYSVRFVDPAWGFSMGWLYTFGWLVTLPYELTAASLTIDFWRSDINIGVWITVFLVILSIVQIFGVRGYGEVEFILSTIKIIACIGFIILGIIINCGGVPTDDRGYIGGRYWRDPGAFRNGFQGFCSVFVTAAFAFGGTEMVGLASAEARNPAKALPKASKQVFWRITFFYIVNLLIVGLIVPSDNPELLGASNSNTKASPFVLAIRLAGIKVLPSIFNAIITISVISVANSCTYGSTRTLQALAESKMAPKFFAYIDSKGRPIWPVITQLAFGLLAFINEGTTGTTVLYWLLDVAGLSSFFCWGSICLAHIRFRQAWKAQGRSLDEIPYKAGLGVWGSAFGLFLVIICLISQFYIALWPVGGTPNATAFFESYISAVISIVGTIVWKLWERDWAAYGISALWTGGWSFGVRVLDMDLDAGRRSVDGGESEEGEKGGGMGKKGWRGLWKRVGGYVF
ncbi:MAG: hypothetical protein M1834_005393 [Cirrosporium novae-zelandiae]|nr:MAG: hypothetical protein M1834_005393 [Cirrosporium novae-zelandiae]